MIAGSGNDEIYTDAPGLSKIDAGDGNNNGVATTAEQRLIVDVRNGRLFCDEEGSGALMADHIAALIGVRALSAEQITFFR